LKHSRWRRV